MKNGQGKRFRSPKRVFASVSESGPVGQTDLFSHIENHYKETEGKRNHESDPSCGEKGDWLEKPDDAILKLSGPGNGCEEDRIAKHEPQPPEGEGPDRKPIPAHRNPRKERQMRTWSEANLKEEEDKKEDDPGPEVTEKWPEG
jgi:hypothetical protein